MEGSDNEDKKKPSRRSEAKSRIRLVERRGEQRR